MLKDSFVKRCFAEFALVRSQNIAPYFCSIRGRTRFRKEKNQILDEYGSTLADDPKKQLVVERKFGAKEVEYLALISRTFQKVSTKRNKVQIFRFFPQLKNIS